MRARPGRISGFGDSLFGNYFRRVFGRGHLVAETDGTAAISTISGPLEALKVYHKLEGEGLSCQRSCLMRGSGRSQKIFQKSQIIFLNPQNVSKNVMKFR